MSSKHTASMSADTQSGTVTALMLGAHHNVEID